MSKKIRMVRGVGINDAGYQIYASAVVCGRKKQIWICPFYRVWKDMLDRCYSEKEHVRRPNYAGCTVAIEWHSFTAFRAWMIAQDWEGKQLDKDILLTGNKVYGPDTCVFVSGELNSFLNDNGASRGEWPLGVSWNKIVSKFHGYCCNPFDGRLDFLGLFTCPGAAHEAWRKRKHELACKYADVQEDSRVADALRTRYTKNTEGENA